jgi:hypothetical protein
LAVVVVAVVLGGSSYLAQQRKARRAAEALLAETVEPTPSVRTIRPEDVLGAWRFYVDAAASTVTVELLAEGRYRQVIVRNSGEQTECSGGTWTLEGPFIELSSYRDALSGATHKMRWFFGDWQGDLALFATDDPEAAASLLALRQRSDRV